MNHEIKERIKFVVTLLQAKDPAINLTVDKIIVASLFTAGGTLAEHEDEVRQYLNPKGMCVGDAPINALFYFGGVKFKKLYHTDFGKEEMVCCTIQHGITAYVHITTSAYIYLDTEDSDTNLFATLKS